MSVTLCDKFNGLYDGVFFVDVDMGNETETSQKDVLIMKAVVVLVRNLMPYRARHIQTEISLKWDHVI